MRSTRSPATPAAGLLCAVALATMAPAASAQTQPATAPLTDASLVVTVMQFTPRAGVPRDELLKRMAAMRAFQHGKPGLVDNVIMENRNPDGKPAFVGVARWRTLKDWEALWTQPTFQELVRSITEVGDLSPGTYAPLR